MNTHRIKTGALVIALLGFSLMLGSCEEQDDPTGSSCNPTGEQGELVETSYMTTFTPAQIQPYLSGLGVPLAHTVDYAVDVYKVSYISLDKSHNLTPVSGLMLIPKGLDTLDMMSVQHGTSIKRDEVGSVNSLYAFDAILMAMDGYLVVAPDYLGLGDSQVLHPYLHAELTANTVMDIIRAGRSYACENDLLLSDKLFLTGYSEGGYATLTSQRVMETFHAEEFVLTAVAPLAGPYDLVGSTYSLFEQETYDNPAFLSYLVVSYNDVYGWDRLDEIFNEPFASALPTLFDGSLSGGDINRQLTTQIDSLFRTDFVTAYLNGEELEINAALEENALLDWGPIAPVRLIHGTADQTVNYENSVVAQASMLANGGVSVELVPIQGGDHVGSAFIAYYLAGEWFDSLR